MAESLKSEKNKSHLSSKLKRKPSKKPEKASSKMNKPCTENEA
jgi:hypothetical protein